MLYVENYINSYYNHHYKADNQCTWHIVCRCYNHCYLDFSIGLFLFILRERGGQNGYIGVGPLIKGSRVRILAGLPCLHFWAKCLISIASLHPSV